ncbi:MAG: YjjG family noncanonical pyrimidine nucleotidase [Cytophagales bacterium]|nr:YjjG family noncanonical pyrimidine nucleotidase [Cytophagales bacterium]
MPYKHLFFDLDDTLWDSRRNADETLRELFAVFRLAEEYGLEEDTFVAVFQRVNYALWDRYSAGEITQQQLRDIRFPLVFGELGIKHLPNGSQMQAFFLATCPRKPHLMPHASEVLQQLRGRYRLHIITNGFDDVQFVKMESSGIAGYFEEVVTSLRAGCQKPNRLIFDYARHRTQAAPADCLMIGDNLLADIAGAQNAEIDHVFYNPGRVTHQFWRKTPKRWRI